MHVNQIRHFLDVVRTHSVTQSAANLYITPQGLSRSIAQLEREAGLVLFTRTNRGSELTADGRRFLPLAEDILRSYEEFEREVAKLSVASARGAEGGLKLVVPPLFTISDMLSRMLDRLAEEMPDVRISVSEHNSCDMIDYACNLSDEQLARTLLIATVPEYRVKDYLSGDRYLLTTLFDIPMGIRVSEGHPLASRRNVTRAELARERITCYAEPVIEEVTNWLLADYGGADYAFKGSVSDLAERFPDAVSISGSYPGRPLREGCVDIPIRDTVTVHAIAIAANPTPSLVRQMRDCCQGVFGS